MELYSYDLLQVPNFKNIVLGLPIENDILNVIDYSTKNNSQYKIIRYNKDILDEDDINTIGRIRSVIVNSENKVVSISPSKSLKIDKFTQKYPKIEEINNNIIGEQFIEGTMINLFWDPSIGVAGGWEIATRNTVGAEVSFYKSSTSEIKNNETSHNKTFNEMFRDACTFNNVDLTLLKQEYCYSFVLQHPENRIVVPFKQTQLYLIEVYKIQHTTDNIMVHNVSLLEFNSFGLQSTSVQIPQVYEYNTYDELISKYASNNTSYDIVGVVFKNLVTGERTKKRNPVYEEIKQLRGNQPKIQYQYLCLRKEGKVKEFLEYFPEYKKEFAKFRKQLHDFTNTLFSNYKECFIKKEKKHNEYSLQYRNHMFVLHSTYRDELMSRNLYITNTFVIKYVNSLHPSQQMHSLNYNLKKRMIDFVKADALNLL